MKTRSGRQAKSPAQSATEISDTDQPQAASQSAASVHELVSVNNNNLHVDLSKTADRSKAAIDIKLEPFSPDKDAQQWFKMFCAFAQLKLWNESIMLLSFPFYLSPQALDWYHTLQSDVTASWSSLSRTFLENFSISRAEHFTKLQQLLNRKQQPMESVTSFLQDITKMSTALGRTEAQLIEVAIQGLKAHIKRHVIMSNVQSLNDLKNTACLVEAADEAVKSSTKDSPKTVAAVNKPLPKHHFKQRQVKRLNSKSTNTNNVNNKCSRCGYNSHRTGQLCPAMGKTCNKCSRPNHFQAVCFTPASNNNNSNASGQNHQNSQ